jgi:5'-phosphate synthase pdxT subunit
VRTAGVLALQGDARPHVASFARLGLTAREVRAPCDLDGLTHLVLPGGESTTLHHLLALFGLDARIREAHAAGELALFGTCAGAILASRDTGERPPRLGLLDARVRRNAYGHQIDSFTRPLRIEGIEDPFPGVFIRAPRFTELGPSVRVLARDGDDPVLVEAPGVLAATFHPELTDDPTLHARFLELAPAASPFVER